MEFKQDRNRLVKIWDLLCAHFNKDELQTFCFLLGEDYDNFGDQGKESRAREMVLHFYRHGRIEELIHTWQAAKTRYTLE